MGLRLLAEFALDFEDTPTDDDPAIDRCRITSALSDALR